MLSDVLRRKGLDTLAAVSGYVKEKTGVEVSTSALSRFLNHDGGISSRNLVALQQAFPEVAQASWAELVQLPQADLQNTEH